MPEFRSMARLVADWRRSNERMHLLTSKLPRMIGVETKTIIKQNFQLEGYDDGISFSAWKAREESTNRRYDKRYGVKGSVFQSSNKILHQTGNLEDSIDYKRVFVGGANGELSIVLFVGVNLALIPYAEIHNEGGHGMAWGKVPFVMPKRQYMPLPGEGPNRKMMRAYEKKVKYETQQAMAEFTKR